MKEFFLFFPTKNISKLADAPFPSADDVTQQDIFIYPAILFLLFLLSNSLEFNVENRLIHVGLDSPRLSHRKEPFRFIGPSTVTEIIEISVSLSIACHLRTSLRFSFTSPFGCSLALNL